MLPNWDEVLLSHIGSGFYKPVATPRRVHLHSLTHYQCHLNVAAECGAVREREAALDRNLQQLKALQKKSMIS